MEHPGRLLFVVYDKVAETFLFNIVIDRHPAPACRQFNDALAAPDSALAKHPADYQLLHIGYIEDSGQLVPIVPQVIHTGEAWLSSQSQESGS